ncbi:MULTISPECIES: hypothetical protein [Mesorhizobium]|uniref:hypothetical protein n=1 Tax=Mesorhizobium TaxID=68287 RepID=UPI002477EA82|nr:MULTISPECIES: hypothetical protein [Mesorhizobium]
MRRFIPVGEVDFLVGELGLYSVHPDLERPGMSHSTRVMGLVQQQLGIPFAFGTVRHALRNRLERFCRDALATMVPGLRVATHDRDRHCAPGLPLGTGIFVRSVAASRPSIPRRDPRKFRSFASKLALAVPRNGK